MPGWRALSGLLLAVGIPLGGAAAAVALVERDSFDVDTEPTTAAVTYRVEPAAPLFVAATANADIPEVPSDDIIALGAASGTVTSTAEAGADPGNAAPFTELYAVDDTPVFLLASTTPWWRDLRSGLEGTDVTELRLILTDAGLPTRDTPELQCSELNALNDLLRINAPRHPGRNCTPVPIAQFVWRRGHDTAGDSTSAAWTVQLGGPAPAAGSPVITLEATTVDVDFESEVAFPGDVTGTLIQVGLPPTPVDVAKISPTQLTVPVPVDWLTDLVSVGADSIQVRFTAADPTTVVWLPTFSLGNTTTRGMPACVTVSGREIAGVVVDTDGAFAAFAPDDIDAWPSAATVGPGDGSCR